jgi:signal transduction histidine kinase
MQNLLPVNESRRLVELCLQMEQFTSKLAHDLLGALQVITGYADLLAGETKGLLEPEQLECLNFIQVGARGVRDTIEHGQAQLLELIQSQSKLQ